MWLRPFGLQLPATGERRETRVNKAKRCVLPLRGVIDADPFRGNDSWLIVGSVQEIKLGSGKIHSVLRTGDLRCPGEPTWPREVRSPAVEWLGTRMSTAWASPAVPRHDVQHLVHPVNQVHIGVSRSSEEHLGSPRPPPGGVRRQVLGAEISFCLHNARPQRLPRECVGRVSSRSTPWPARSRVAEKTIETVS